MAKDIPELIKRLAKLEGWLMVIKMITSEELSRIDHHEPLIEEVLRLTKEALSDD
jgi:hypothetical protein